MGGFIGFVGFMSCWLAYDVGKPAIFFGDFIGDAMRCFTIASLTMLKDVFFFFFYDV